MQKHFLLGYSKGFSVEVFESAYRNKKSLAYAFFLAILIHLYSLGKERNLQGAFATYDSFQEIFFTVTEGTILP